MHLDSIKLTNFRLFESLNFSPSCNINLIIGANGAGKTSLLESIYLLARNRSFRTNNNSHLIHKNKTELIIKANLIHDSGQNFLVGLRKTNNKTELHIAGEKQRRVSDQARKIPLGIITANTQKLFTEGPKSRRKFLNWGVFHVEHDYADLITNYNKVLIQRNAALRSGHRTYKAWDKQLIHYGNRIDLIRKKYFYNLQNYLSKLLTEHVEFRDLIISYKQGWNKDQSLKDAISNNHDEFCKYTYYGPHRSDIGIYINKKSAIDYLSSGQLKLLAILFIIAQFQLIQNITKEKPIILFDDIQSEIDQMKKRYILQMVASLGCQTFITSIEPTVYTEDGFKVQMFHVEHGEIF